MPDLPTRLARLGLTQAELRRWLEAVTGRKIAQSTLSRNATGETPPSPWLEALLVMLEKHPDLIKELKR